MQKPSLKPRYLVLADYLRDRIGRGDLVPGDRLPSENDLSREFGVSRGTVVKAIEQLVGEGSVHRYQGSGSFVARPSLHRRAGSLLSFSQSAAGDGHRSSQKLVSLGPALPDQIRQFDCPSPAVSLVRLRSIDGVACAVHRSLVPLAVAMKIPALNGDDAKALENPEFSLYRAFDEAGFHIEDATERVTTRLANAEESRLLGLSGPTAVMVVVRMSFDDHERLIEAVEAVYHGDYYTYDMQLVRNRRHQTGAGDSNVLSLGGRLSKANEGNQ